MSIIVKSGFKCTLADPPWPEKGAGKCKRGADRYYSTLKPHQILGVTLKSPLWTPADNSHLWLWVTSNFLKQGLWLMEALGFRYIKDFPWIKMKDWELQKPGLGQYAGGQHEILLFGVRGRLPALWKDKTTGAKRPGTVILAARREHSRKPDEQYDTIENISPGPRAELFARHPRVGWMSWGDGLNGVGVGQCQA